MICELPVQMDVRTLVMDLIRAGSGPRGISVDQIINEALASGYPRNLSWPQLSHLLLMMNATSL